MPPDQNFQPRRPPGQKLLVETSGPKSNCQPNAPKPNREACKSRQRKAEKRTLYNSAPGDPARPKFLTETPARPNMILEPSGLKATQVSVRFLQAMETQTKPRQPRLSGPPRRKALGTYVLVRRRGKFNTTWVGQEHNPYCWALANVGCLQTLDTTTRSKQRSSKMGEYPHNKQQYQAES
jgi:hypothetical protein